jgi:hypothetical protein
MAQRLLHALTKDYYMSMSCFATASRVDKQHNDSACSAQVSWVDTRYHGPSCTMWAWVESQANPHSAEQDTLPIVFLISKQAAPYRTRGGTCCPLVSTPKIQCLADSSTTCHDGINHLHHPNERSNHSINPHHISTDGRPQLSH